MQLPGIIFSDDSILVIDKPAGMPSASLKRDEEGSLAAWITARYPDQAMVGNGALEAGLCNRLDNASSGLIVAARTPDAYESLRQQFESGAVKKEYLALVMGAPPDTGTIELHIAHHPRKKSKMVACESEERAIEWKGRTATTEFAVITRYELYGKKAGLPIQYALIAVRIKTGVRHQIRVHLAHLGHPLAGDRLYQNPKKRLDDLLQLDRHFLHCSRISFKHPATGATVEFESPLPQELQKALQELRAC